MQRRFTRLSRRQLLRSLGLSAAVSPLIPLLNATGQENVRPKRLLLVFTPDGAAARDWNSAIDWSPQGTETAFTLHPMHQPFAAHQSKVIIPHGLTMSAEGAGEAHAHGMAGLWTGSILNGPSGDANFDGGNGARTGWGSGASIDQLVARASGTNTPYAVGPDEPQQETAYRSVQLGVQTGNPTSLNRNIYAAENSPIHPETNPRAAFDRLFANVVPADGQTSPPAEDPSAVAARAEQQAIVDLLQDDLQRLRQRVGSQEYQKLDAHLEGLLALEQRLNASVTTPTPTLGCAIPEAPPESSGGALGGGGASFPDEITQMIDIVAHALACDVTRVASLQISYGFSNVTHTWLGQTSAHHTMSHDLTDRRAELEAIDTWYATQFNYLLDHLDSVDEGGSTLLDNTLVVWGRELGTTAHRFENVPFVVAGGGGFGLNTGRYLSLGNQKHAKLLVSIAQHLGLDLNGVGNIDPDSGPIAGL